MATKQRGLIMDYYEMLKQSYIEDNMSKDELVEDAILSLEQQFSYMNADDLINRSRPLAIAYLALREIRDSGSKKGNNLCYENLSKEQLEEELEKYRHSMFIIGETCVDASKQHITAERALDKIRKNIYYKSPYFYEKLMKE